MRLSGRAFASLPCTRPLGSILQQEKQEKLPPRTEEKKVNNRQKENRVNNRQLWYFHL